MSKQQFPAFIYGFTRHEEVQAILKGTAVRPGSRCRLCRRPIRIVERDYQRAGICGDCAHQIVMWYAEAHGDGIYGMCGVEDPSPSPRGYKKRKIGARKQVAVWRRDGFKCVRCGSTKDLTVDHIVAEVKGGASDLANFQTLCQSCNSKKGTRGHARAAP